MYYNHNTTISNHISCLIEDGKIYQIDYTNGNKMEIGVTNDTYNEQTKILDEYYEKLIELGIIEKEKTPEEKEEEQRLLMKSMLEQMENLKDEIKEMKKNERPIVKGNDKSSCKNDGDKRPE